MQQLIRAPETSVSTHYDSPVNMNKNDTIDGVPTESYDEELIDSVNIYYNFIRGNNIIKDDAAMAHYKCGHLIQHKHIQILEYNLITILKKMYNHYDEHLPNQSIVLENRNFEQNIYDIFESDYVETICSHFPRCLDFFYICSAQHINANKLFELHADVCLSRRTFLEENQPFDVTHEEANNWSETTENIHVVALYKHFSTEPFMNIKTDSQELDRMFVKNIFEIVNYTDKKYMIPSSYWESKTITNNIYSLKGLQIFPPVDNDETLNRGLMEIVEQHLRTFTEGSELPLSYDYPYTDDTLVFRLSELTLNVFQGFENLFLNGISDGPTSYEGVYNIPDADGSTNVGIDDKAMKEMLSIDMLSRICEHVPLALYHFSVNHAIHPVLFSMYLTLCSDWTDFLNDRCRCYKSATGVKLYDLQCVRQSVNEKLTLNKYMARRTIVNAYDVHGSLRKTIVDDRCDDQRSFPDMKTLELIMENIHGKLNDYYAHKNVYVWPTFDWLSAKHLFTDHYSPDDMYGIREQKVELDDGSVSMLEMFSQLLPWNLNLETIVGFKTLTEKYVFYNVFKYIWRQAKIIQFYFDHQKVEHIPHEVFQRLKKSTAWYKTGTPKLYTYFSVMKKQNPYEPPAVVVRLVNAIENVEKESTGNMSDLINQMDTKYSMSWIVLDNLLKGNFEMTNNLAKRLSKIYVENCFNALQFINTLISFINKSKLENTNINGYNVQTICNVDGLHDVFVADSKTKHE